MDLDDLLALYDPAKPLAEASTIPGPWYTDPRVLGLENGEHLFHRLVAADLARAR